MRSASTPIADPPVQTAPGRGRAAFRTDPLPLERVRALLSSAFGLHHPACWGRAAPPADSAQEIIVYAVRSGGAYRYDSHQRRMQLARAGDLRGVAGMRELLAAAPLVLVYVKEDDATQQAHAEEHGVLACNSVDCLVENVERDCAHAGLTSMVQARTDGKRLEHALGLKPTERVVLVQSVGYPQPAAH